MQNLFNVQNMRHIRYIVLLTSIVCLYLFVYLYTTPGFSLGKYYQTSNATVDVSHPLTFDQNKNIFRNIYTFNFVSPLLSQNNGGALGFIDMYVQEWRPNIYHILPDDCLRYFSINNHNVLQGRSICDWKNGALIDLSSYLQTGKNTIAFTLSNSSGELSLHIRPSIASSLVSAIHVVFLTLIFCVCFWWSYPIRKKMSLPIQWMIFSSILVRFWYVLLTPYKVRSHDAAGHIEYMIYVLQNWNIPPLTGGWQMYQPPLYYFFTSFFLLPAKFFGATFSSLIDIMQIISLLLSIAAVLIAAWVAHILFSHKHEEIQRVLFVGVVAALPALIFSSSRISNDTMLLPIWFLLFGFLLRFWQYKTVRDWYIVVVLFSLSILTKWNALALAPLLAVCLIVQLYANWRQLLKVSCISVIIFSVFTGPMFFKRIIHEQQGHIIGNIKYNNPELFTKAWSPLNLIALKPIEMIRYPFNDSWNDTYGRGYYWLYMPKSVFTGEWNFGSTINKVLQGIYVLNMVFLLIAIFEIFYEMLKNRLKKFPIWGTIFMLIASSMILQINQHNGGLQDFRYITLLALPVTYFVLTGMQRCTKLRRIFYALLSVFIISLFILSVMIAYR